MNSRPTFIQVTLILNGLVNLLSGLGLLFFPRWFFENIGNFPPYNRHSAGDAGAFLLPWGVALLTAAREPEKHRTLIAVATLANVLHALNHLIGDWVIERLPLEHLVKDNVPIVVLAGLLVVAYVRLIQAKDLPL